MFPNITPTPHFTPRLFIPPCRPMCRPVSSLCSSLCLTGISSGLHRRLPGPDARRRGVARPQPLPGYVGRPVRLRHPNGEVEWGGSGFRPGRSSRIRRGSPRRCRVGPPRVNPFRGMVVYHLTLIPNILTAVQVTPYSPPDTRVIPEITFPRGKGALTPRIGR